MKKASGLKLPADTAPLFRDRELAGRMVEAIAEKAGRLPSVGRRRANFMEVCGTHTMSIAAAGLRRLLPKPVKMLSGPGCPVCVTSQGDIDRLIELALVPGVTVATFGDMLKVKGSKGLDLQAAREKGADVRVVYSPLDALDIAGKEPSRKVVFIGVGFETTAPVIGGVLARARTARLGNFFVAPLFKLVPPALGALLAGGEAEVDGFIMPGHVSAIIGPEPYRFVAEKYKVPCVIAGFEPLDILRGIDALLGQVLSGRPVVDTEYSRVVKAGGNPAALKLMSEVFAPADASWRAIGRIPGSGLTLSPAYRKFDAFAEFGVAEREAPEPKGCICGRILTGKASPPDCRLFGKACTPSSAVGPCMVSSEGACAAWFKYGG